VTEALRLRENGIRTLGVRWDPRSPVFRVDVPESAASRAVELACAVLGTCNDPTVPGYPYPLARAHGRVRYPGDAVVDLRRGMEAIISERQGSRIGMRLFGRGRDLLDLGT
jgi:NurA-like 5'-3' nuclease